MSLKLITLAAFAATAQAACTADESTAMTDCVTKEMKAMGTASDACKATQAMYACYPACYCDDANYKSIIDAGIDSLKKTMPDCAIKCGAGSALAPGMALTLALMVAARLYE